jgi:SMC interacting uncharacterized protein involved in chromosome segregation
MPIKTKPEPTVSLPQANHPDEQKEGGSRYNLSKFEFDLYHEEDDIAEKVIRVKRVSMPNKGEKWKIMLDSKVTFIIEGSKLSKKEREYLETVDGFNFILAQAKVGIKSLNSFKTELKKIIK